MGAYLLTATERPRVNPVMIDTDRISLRPVGGNLLDAEEVQPVEPALVAAPDFDVAEVGVKPAAYLEALDAAIDEDRAAHGKKPLKDKADKCEAEVGRLTGALADLDRKLAGTVPPGEAAKLSKERGLAASALQQAEENWLSAQDAYDSALAES